MTPRGIIAAAQYAPTAPKMTKFAQGVAAVIHSSHEQSVPCSLAHNSSTSFQKLLRRHHRLPTRSTSRIPPHDAHLEKMDLSYPIDGAGTSQAEPYQPSRYQSPPLPDRHTNIFYYRRRYRRLS
ncbi:uncharacterized protein LOC130806423 [Amaranthus tricolor]|uniref:uncharacterized protein LOC130806423 n=1 Tax=Amaranthus tricolor TaxID=29722 RepID=UPI00258C6835|nr:uncharacterized protein LOC130806423 [Amaranthus tricolor]